MHATARRRTPAALLIAALALGGCGDDDDAGSPAGPTEPNRPSTSAAAEELTFTAVDIDFERDEAQARAGELHVMLVNQGALEHSWTVEGHEDDVRLYTQQAGQTDQGTVALEEGEHTYYCDIPGHRAAGMEGTLTLG